MLVRKQKSLLTWHKERAENGHDRDTSRNDENDPIRTPIGSDSPLSNWALWGIVSAKNLNRVINIP